jgi:hypothetical protein
MLDVVIAFLKDPHSLAISVEPPKPLSVSFLSVISFIDLKYVPALLGLTIK